ncbi:uncharacterized protein [Antedon mediterranea]|uniref:uncharacterized protein n=1 Tax=Antedon mediterranea TaxID=105859 RepID=UPI003AF9FACA
MITLQRSMMKSVVFALLLLTALCVHARIPYGCSQVCPLGCANRGLGPDLCPRCECYLYPKELPPPRPPPPGPPGGCSPICPSGCLNIGIRNGCAKCLCSRRDVDRGTRLG